MKEFIRDVNEAIKNVNNGKFVNFVNLLAGKGIIIAGFPGVGKSTAVSEYKGKSKVIDMESSEFHWLYDENGNKYCNPEWPYNYVDAITDAAKSCDEDTYVLISTHNEVLNLLNEDSDWGSPFIAVIPKTKSIYIDRYKQRGSSKEFIEKLDIEFDNFTNDVKMTQPLFLICTDGYMSDILTQIDKIAARK